MELSQSGVFSIVFKLAVCLDGPAYQSDLKSMRVFLTLFYAA